MEAWVLAGGAFNGGAQIPILEHLIKTRGLPDCIYGTSVGAINGVLAAQDEMHLCRQIWENLDDKSWWFGVDGIQSFSLFRRKGIYSLRPLQKKLQQYVSRDKLKTVFGAGVVVRDIPQHYILRSDKMPSDTHLHTAVLASAAMAGIHEPWLLTIKGKKMLGSDGGHWHPVPPPPVDADEIIAVLTGPIDGGSLPSSSTNDFKSAVSWGAGMAVDLAHHYDIQNLRDMAAAGKKVTIFAPERTGDMFDADKETIQRRFNLGEAALDHPIVL